MSQAQEDFMSCVARPRQFLSEEDIYKRLTRSTEGDQRMRKAEFKDETPNLLNHQSTKNSKVFIF